MVFTNASRAAIVEVDAKWKPKFAVRMVMNLICILSIICAVYTISHTSIFKVTAYDQAAGVLLYVPFNALTILWNVINIAALAKRKRPLKAFGNVLIHLLLTVVFVIVGLHVTKVAYTAFTQLGTDMYGMDQGPHSIVTMTGQNVTVTAKNIGTCPAFSSCDAQQSWLNAAKIRGMVSVIGCALFDAIFLFHALLFMWYTKDAIYGPKGRSERERADLEKRLWRVNDDESRPGTAETEQSFFNVGAAPSRNGHSSNNPYRTTLPGVSRDSVNDSFTNLLPESALSKPSRIPATVESRDSLSLSIFDSFDLLKSSSFRRASGAPRTPVDKTKRKSGQRGALQSSIRPTPHRSSTAPIIPPITIPLQSKHRSSSYSLLPAVATIKPALPIQSPPRSSISSLTTVDFARKPHPRYSYFRRSLGTSSLATSQMSAGVEMPEFSSQGSRDAEQDLTALPSRPSLTLSQPSQYSPPRSVKKKSRLRDMEKT